MPLRATIRHLHTPPRRQSEFFSFCLKSFTWLIRSFFIIAGIIRPLPITPLKHLFTTRPQRTPLQAITLSQAITPPRRPSDFWYFKHLVQSNYYQTLLFFRYYSAPSYYATEAPVYYSPPAYTTTTTYAPSYYATEAPQYDIAKFFKSTLFQ